MVVFTVPALRITEPYGILRNSAAVFPAIRSRPSRTFAPASPATPALHCSKLFAPASPKPCSAAPASFAISVSRRSELLPRQAAASIQVVALAGREPRFVQPVTGAVSTVVPATSSATRRSFVRRGTLFFPRRRSHARNDPCGTTVMRGGSSVVLRFAS